jgi:hypothetical protein
VASSPRQRPPTVVGVVLRHQVTFQFQGGGLPWRPVAIFSLADLGPSSGLPVAVVDPVVRCLSFPHL